MDGRGTQEASERLGHRQVLSVALPIIFSNVTTPLIGVVDTAVMGRLGPPELIGGVAFGSIIFGVIYWAFGFLRMGTTGLTAQSAGAGNRGEASAVLIRSLLIAVAGGAASVLLQGPIRWVSLGLLEGSPESLAVAGAYFDVRIWSAPATFVNYTLLGWFIGLRRANVAFFLQLTLNLINIALSIGFVAGLGMEIEGVALAAVLAEIGAAAAGLVLASKELKAARHELRWERILEAKALARVFAVNGDIMIRTLCLMSAFFFFMAQSARTGDITLAANAALFEFVAVFAYFLDGFAMAGEALTGAAVGGGSLEQFRRAFLLSSLWAGAFSVVLAVFFWLAGGALIDMMAVDPQVRAEARLYLGWTAIAPVMGIACFQLDGAFIGATQTADMRNMMAASLAAFVAAWAVLTPLYGNHGLWAALMLFYVTRGATLAVRYPALERAAFPARS